MLAWSPPVQVDVQPESAPNKKNDSDVLTTKEGPIGALMGWKREKPDIVYLYHFPKGRVRHTLKLYVSHILKNLKSY